MKRWFALPLCILAACSESFLPASAVVDLRVVGALVEVQDKPGRANPDPGDMIQVSNLVIDRGHPPSTEPAPLSPPPLQWSLVACVPEPTVLALPLCRNVLPCEGCEATPPADPLALPIVRFQVPSATELEAAEATSVVLQGAICANGAPAGLDAIIAFVTGETDVLEPCEDPNNEGRFISVPISIEQEPGNPNLNPTIADVTLNGKPWPPPFDQGVPRDIADTGCASFIDDGSELPRAGGAVSIIELTATDDSFQEYTVGDMTLTEEMQVSWLADGGGFEFSFSFLTAPARTATIQWAPPGFANPQGSLVRFNFLIRDGRGGINWVDRGLCVLP